MKKNVKKHTNGVWYYAVVRWDGYGVFTSWDRAREECDGYSDNKKKKFKRKKYVCGFFVIRNFCFFCQSICQFIQKTTT